MWSIDMKKTLKNKINLKSIIFFFVFVLFLVYALSLIYPLLWMTLNSFKSKAEYNADQFSFPQEYFVELTPFQNYIEAWTKIKVGGDIGVVGMFMNSIWYAAGSATVIVFFCSMTAYIIAKYTFKGRNFLYGMALAMMMIPIVGALPATYKLYNNLHLVDSPLFLITYSGGFGGYFMILYASYKGISWNYAEAAMIDGANGYVVYFKIMMPQAVSALFTLWLLQFIAQWNDYTTPLLYLSNMPNLATGLMRFEKATAYKPNWPVYYAGLVILVLPILIIFSVFSERIMTSVSTGGLKG